MRFIARTSLRTRPFRPLLPLAALSVAIPASADVLTWPGSPPCNGTLQACITAANTDDVVEVASDGPIGESIEIFGKSLTLRPAAGFAPVFQAGSSTDVIEAFGGDAAVTITIEGMTVRDGFIGAYQAGSGMFTAIIRENVVQAEGLGANLTGIRLSAFGASATGPLGFLVYDNAIHLEFEGGDDISAIGVDDVAGPTAGLIIANSITGGGASSALGAIRIRNAAGTADIEVRHNRIEAPGYNAGILIDQDDSGGAMTARVLNNLVTGTIDYMGPQPGAISVFSHAGSLDATVLSNTLAANGTGFAANVAPGAGLVGVLANTLIAGNTNHGVVISAAAALGFHNEHNLVFGNGADAFTPGPGTIEADPLLVGAGDFHPQRGSPVRDAGNSDYAEGIDVDLDGAWRVTGPAIDIGAWELADSIFADGFDA